MVSHSRLLGFGGCLIGAAVCFFIAFMTLPLRPAKFALSFRCDIHSLSYPIFLNHSLSSVSGACSLCLGELLHAMPTDLGRQSSCSRFTVLVGPINHIKHLFSRGILIAQPARLKLNTNRTAAFYSHLLLQSGVYTIFLIRRKQERDYL